MDQATKPNTSASETPDEPSSGPVVDLTGQTLGDYKILRRLGQGGMGQVYLAEQVSLKRHVALKLLKAELAANVKALARFKAEAEAVAKATHANIVQVYAIHEIGGHHLMALEYVEGRNLREYLEKKGPPEILLGLSIMRQVAAALQRASELGIIHRDIKPENILLTRKGEVKVADFGLSRVLSDSGLQPVHLTQSHVTMGTPLYMSPEQVEGKKTIDHRTDIYSFGVTCYHMFAGHPPFRGTAPFEVAVQHVQKEPQPLTELRPDLPAELSGIIHKMMAKAPAERYQVGRDIVRDIAKLRDVLVGASQLLAPTMPAIVIGGAPTSDAATVPLPRESRSRWRGRLLVATLPVALLCGLAISWALNQTAPAAQTSPKIVPMDTVRNPPPLPSVVPSLGDKEQALLKRIEQHNAKPTINLDVMADLQAAIELGILYLKDPEHLGDADRFFKKLAAKQNLYVHKTLGRLGGAMVLAFKDQPEDSNRQFMAVLAGKLDKDNGRNPFWNNYLPLRETMARALNFNLQNQPGSFPEKLRPFLHPPAPNVKTP